jgi:hypothetical protein
MGPWSLDTSQNISKPSSPIFTRASLADYKGPPWQVPWWPTRSAALGRPGRIIRIQAKAVGLTMAHVPLLENPPEVGITRHESDLTWLDEVSRSFTLEQLGSVVNSNTRSIRYVTLCIDMLRKALSSQHGLNLLYSKHCPGERKIAASWKTRAKLQEKYDSPTIFCPVRDS